MGRLDQINQIRRSVTHLLTKNIGNSDRKYDSAHPIERVLISRPNGRLGNLLMVTPLVQEIEAYFPTAKIDLFVKGGASTVIFENYRNIDRIIQLPGKPFKSLFNYFKIWYSIRKNRYDLVINIDPDSSSGRLSSTFAKSEYRIFGNEEHLEFADAKHMAKQPVYALRDFVNEQNHMQVPTLSLRLSDAEIRSGKSRLDQIVDTERKTIAIFTFATGNKIYPVLWWETIYSKLRTAFPDYNILEILPIQNVSQLDFKAPAFYSKDIREIAAVIANTVVFIGADSGMMHLASAAQTPVAGLFHATNLSKYMPYGNSSEAIDTNQCDDKMIIATIKNMISARQSAKMV